MDDEIKAYIELLTKMHEIRRPKMPKFNLKTYNDNEYLLAIKEVMADFKAVDLIAWE